MIRYSQIENLPPDHPLVKAFEKQERDLDECYAESESSVMREDSAEYFDRYVAGDRK